MLRESSRKETRLFGKITCDNTETNCRRAAGSPPHSYDSPFHLRKTSEEIKTDKRPTITPAGASTK